MGIEGVEKGGEVKETPAPAVKALTAEEMQEIVYGDASEPQDQRFFTVEKGGVFEYFSPRDTLPSLITLKEGRENTKFFLITEESGEIAGIALLEQSHYDENIYNVMFVSVDSKYQGAGHARALVAGIFDFAKEHDIALQGSMRSVMGTSRLAHLFTEYAKVKGVKYTPT